MNPLYYLLSIPLFLIGLTIQNFRQRRRMYSYLRKTWGKPPKKTYYDKLPSVKQYWQAVSTERSEFQDIDEITWNDLDMDLYFQSINSTFSSIGSETLYARLHRLNPPTIEHMVEVLSQDESLRIELSYYLYGIGKKDDNQAPDFLFHPKDKQSLRYHPIQSWLPVVGFAISWLSYPIGLLLTVLSIGFNFYTRMRYRLLVENGAEAVSYMSKAIVFSRKIKSLTKDTLPEYSNQLHAAVQTLNQLPSRFLPVKMDPSNLLFNLMDYLNHIFLFDFSQYNRAIKILTKQPGALLNLWEIIGELEVALVVLSLDTRTGVTKPSLSSAHGISAKELVHPLLTHPIANDVDFFQSMLISGSNASGKSTYVKAIALSAITAQSLNRVYANEWHMLPGKVITSMAIRDNLDEGDSYFVAEIKSLKRMIDATKSEEPLYLFIDEILKGTNTIERIAASNALLSYLQEKGALVIAATHDIELTELQAEYMRNVHFRETVSDETIVFDYLLKDGPTQTTNAINLLRYYNFPEIVTENASHQAERFKELRHWH